MTAHHILKFAADRIEALEGEVERLTTNGIHTCHDNCRRFPCVQGREIRRLEGEVDAQRDRATVAQRHLAAARSRSARSSAALKAIAVRAGTFEGRGSFTAYVILTGELEAMADAAIRAAAAETSK